MKIDRMFCPTCDKLTKCSCDGANHLLHFLLALVTAGFWLLVWPLVIWRAGRKWRCDTCGESIWGRSVTRAKDAREGFRIGTPVSIFVAAWILLLANQHFGVL